MTTKEQLEDYLKDLPQNWRDQLVKTLCEIQESASLDCDKVRECETLTSLSNFSISGTTVSIVYKDENGVSVTRTFDISQIINEYITNNVLPNCLTTQENWENLTFSEKMQLLIDSQCDCCA